MGLDLYYTDLSPDSQSVLMLCQLLDVEINKKLLNVRTGEQKSPDFVKINPQHSLPTIVDDDFALWESRAVLMYLASKYDKSGKLYPSDLQKRALVDRWMFYNATGLQARFQTHYMVTVRNGLPVDPQKFKAVEEGVKLLDTQLEESAFLAGDDLTIADICNLSTIYNYDAAGFPIENYANIKKWMDKCAELGLKYPVGIMAMLKGFFAPKRD